MTIRKLKSCHHIILTLALITRVSPFYQRLPLLPTLAFVTSHYPLLPHITPCCLTLLLLPHIAFYYPRLTLLSHITPCYLTLPLTTHIGLFYLTLSLAGYLTLPLVTSNCFLLPTLPLVTSHYLLLPTLDRFSSHYPLLPHITPCKGQESNRKQRMPSIPFQPVKLWTNLNLMSRNAKSSALVSPSNPSRSTLLLLTVKTFMSYPKPKI